MEAEVFVGIDVSKERLDAALGATGELSVDRIGTALQRWSTPQTSTKTSPPDLPREQAEFESRSRILTAAKVFATPMTAPAWKTEPSWAIVAGADRIINPDLERWYYARAHSHTIELETRATPSTNRIQRSSGFDRGGRAEVPKLLIPLLQIVWCDFTSS